MLLQPSPASSKIGSGFIWGARTSVRFGATQSNASENYAYWFHRNEATRRSRSCNQEHESVPGPTHL